MARHDLRSPRMSRLAFTVLLAVPLALLAYAPGAGRAAAHPASPALPTAPRAPATGQIGLAGSGPKMNLTLHYHSLLTYSFALPEHMGTDAQGNFYVSDLGAEVVDMFDASDNFVRSFGTGIYGTGHGAFGGPEGVAVNGNTIFVADASNNIIQTFNKSTGAWISQFGAGDLASPTGIALGPNGHLYVDDEGHNRIVEYGAAGIQHSFGGLGAGNGQFNAPTDIAASPLGFLYVTDDGNHRVQRFDLNGNYLSQWGSASFVNPVGIALDRANKIYVLDKGANAVYTFDSGGSLVSKYVAPQSTSFVAGTFDTPLDVAVRSAPNMPIEVYVSDYRTDLSAGIVQRFDQVANPFIHTYQAQWGSLGHNNGQFFAPSSATVDHAGNVYVADTTNNRIEKFDQFGNFLFAFGSFGTGNGQFDTPTGLAISPDGTTIFVVDSNNSRIEAFNASGGYVSQFGGPGAGVGQFSSPWGIATDGSYLYVTDQLNYRVEVFRLDGTPVTQFGTHGTAFGQFSDPVGIAVDINRGVVFVADRLNNTVQEFTTAGTFVAASVFTTVAGPVGVATDQRGDVYVADNGDNRIVQLDVNLLNEGTAFFGSAGHGNGQVQNPEGVAVSPANGQIYVVDSGNNRIERWGSPWAKTDSIGIYRPATKTFYLRYNNSTGPADITVPMPYAQTGDLPIVGDWEGTGVDTVGLYRSSTGTFLLQDANVQESAPDYTFTLGIPGDTPIAGDWTGSGHDGVGVFRPSNGILYLKNQLSTGYADNSMVLGVASDTGVAGDWNGDGQDSPGVYRPSNQTFYVSDKVTNGAVFADHTATLGLSGDAPFTGDWNLLGSSGIGVFRPSNGITYEKNYVTTGFADNSFIYGVAGDIPVAGEWLAQPIPFSVPPHGQRGTSGSAPHPAAPAPSPRAPATADRARRTPSSSALRLLSLIQADFRAAW